jgi:hypothetical protein
MKHYNVKEYYGERPCIEPQYMQQLQIRCRTKQPATSKLATMIDKIKNLVTK